MAVTNEEVKFPIRPEMTELSFIFRREKTKPGGNESQIMISYSRKIIRKRVVIITNPIITKRRVGGGANEDSGKGKTTAVPPPH